jgi:FMN-dependent NADH-azoreductase
MNTTPTTTVPTVPHGTTIDTLLVVSASTRGGESVTTALADELVARLTTSDTSVVRRPLDEGLPLLDVAVTAQLTAAPDERHPEAAAVLATADELIAELAAADAVVITAPIYNFGVPAALKAWADLVARAGTTFSYGEQGPVGLLADRPTYVVVASGGTEIGGVADFGSRWLVHFLGFLGIHDVHVVAADRLAVDAEAGLAAARSRIDELTPVAA